jgi:hypothetical protein
MFSLIAWYVRALPQLSQPIASFIAPPAATSKVALISRATSDCVAHKFMNHPRLSHACRFARLCWHTCWFPNFPLHFPPIAILDLSHSTGRCVFAVYVCPYQATATEVSLWTWFFKCIRESCYILHKLTTRALKIIYFEQYSYLLPVKFCRQLSFSAYCFLPG